LDRNDRFHGPALAAGSQGEYRLVFLLALRSGLWRVFGNVPDLTGLLTGLDRQVQFS